MAEKLTNEQIEAIETEEEIAEVLRLEEEILSLTDRDGYGIEC